MTKAEKEANAIKVAEAEQADAVLFVKYLKELIASRGDDHLEGLSQVLIMSGYEHSEAYKKLSSHYANKVLHPATAATKLGLIRRERTGNDPYRWYIVDEPIKLQLRPYQEDIVNTIANTDDNVLLEAPTGAGKTLMAHSIAKDELSKGGKVMFVAPRKSLLEQTITAFADLSPQVIHGNKKYNTDHNVFISTTQTSSRRVDKLPDGLTLIIIDEVHLGYSGKDIKRLLKDYSGRVVALSATPYDKNGKLLHVHLSAFYQRSLYPRAIRRPLTYQSQALH